MLRGESFREDRAFSAGRTPQSHWVDAHAPMREFAPIAGGRRAREELRSADLLPA